MPEYLAPGVFVEEVSFRSKSIEGVPTSTTGFAGMTRFGPVAYSGGPTNCEPRLITSFTEFERVYGGLEPLNVGEAAGMTERIPYLAHAARAFFGNGGKRLYVSRTFVDRTIGTNLNGVASRNVTVTDAPDATWRARWPGAAGNVHVRVQAIRSQNIAVPPAGAGPIRVSRAKTGALIEVVPETASIPEVDAPLDTTTLRILSVDVDGIQTLIDESGADAPLVAGDRALLVELRVTVTVDSERRDVYDELAPSPVQKRYIGKILEKDDPEDEDAVVWLDWTPPNLSDSPFAPALLAAALTANTLPRLENGHDGLLALPDDLQGEPADPDHLDQKATGLEALGEIDDIAIVALPDSGTYGDPTLSALAADHLIAHAENLRYRIAILDPPEGSSLNEVRDFRGRFDSRYGALYYPYIQILDPLERPAQGAPPKRLMLPPSGFVAGIYARTDITRGVHKAPANEVVRGLTRFEANINTPRQEVLNPEGINALRFFEGRGHRVWGARTISSDPEWKYVNVRRLFIYVEHSIDISTQWAVFEPNNRRLWDNIRRSVEDFLLVLWRDGALMGDKPEQAYFVRCDRTTMTQNDLDNGRLVCLIGIAPVKPAEFVIFRIGQWTGDATI